MSFLSNIARSSIFLFSLFSSVALPSVQYGDSPAPALVWYSSYQEGLQKAEAAKLPLYVLFTGPDWCSFCRIMEQTTYSSREFEDTLRNKCIFVKLLLPKNGAPTKEVEELLQRFTIQGIPMAILLSSDGNQELARFGYSRTPPKLFAEEVIRAIGS